jgi:hypothetical protein
VVDFKSPAAQSPAILVCDDTSEPETELDRFGALLSNGEDFEQQIYKEGDIEGDKKKCRDPEFVAAPRKNIRSLPINIFRILDQQIFRDHPIVSRRRN